MYYIKAQPKADLNHVIIQTSGSKSLAEKWRLIFEKNEWTVLNIRERKDQI